MAGLANQLTKAFESHELKQGDLTDEDFSKMQTDQQNTQFFYLGCDLIGTLMITTIFDINYIQMGTQLSAYSIIKWQANVY